MDLIHIAFIGDLTVDIYTGATPGEHLGGSSLTSAIWSKRSGAEPAILAAVGDDYYGQEMLTFLEQQQINRQFIQIISDHPTSHIEIQNEADGERHFGTWEPGALAEYHLDQAAYEFLKTQDAAALTFYAPTKHLLPEVLAAECPQKAIDFGDLQPIGGTLDLVKQYASQIDIALFGLTPTQTQLLDELLLMSKQFPTIFVATLGKEGVQAFHKGKRFTQSAQPVKSVDTTGAGDSFWAGFLVSYLTTKNIPQALLAGTTIAATVVGQYGAY